MLTIIVPEKEFFDDNCGYFYKSPVTELSLEHSLLSISKWESKWHKSFLSSDELSNDEMLDYIKCMTINKNISPLVYKCLTNDNYDEINAYVANKMTATTFTQEPPAGTKEIITSEIIYYWMTTFHIPFECEKWHVNRLLTLIKVCNIKNSPPKKRSKAEIAASNRKLKEERRKMFQEE